MKLRLPSKLVAAIMAAASSATFATLATGSTAYADGTYADANGTNLGTIQFVGDSITHGSDLGGTHDAASWRWALHKIFVDNGITYSENGYHVGNLNQGNYKPVYAAGATYGGVDWENKHSAQASGRAYELITNGNSRYDRNTPDTLVQNYTSDRFFLLIGTNDTLSYYAEGGRGGVGAGNNLATFSADLLGCTATGDSAYTFSGSSRMDTIVDTFHKNTDRTAGTDDDAPVVVLSIPTWSPNHSNNNTAADFAAMAEYNKRMKAWAAQKDGVTYVEVNTGIVDVANTAKPGAGVVSMFNDGLHPSGQGDLIIAGNVAKNLGYAGRTAGLNRADSHTADTAWTSGNALYTINAGQSETLAAGAFSVNDGYTVDFDASFGNGATDNWLDKANALTIAVGDGHNTGALKLSEGYISWGDTILYSQDNSAEGNDRIRIAYHTGDAAKNVDSGYYVWLGDMLIGQALHASSGSLNGITLSAAGATGTVKNLTYSDAAYAPTTSLVSSAEHAFHATLARVMDSHNSEASHLAGVSFDSATASTTAYASATPDVSGNIVISRTGTSTDGYIGAVKDGYAGGSVDLNYHDLSISTGVVLAAWGGTANGSVSIMMDGGTNIDKDGQFNSSGNLSFFGSYSATVKGAVQLEVNDATLKSGIMMGHGNGTGKIEGGTKLIVNEGALIGGNIYGGSQTAGTIDGGASITITGGEIRGSVYGGNNNAGTINDGTSITITGGRITNDVIGGNKSGGTVNGGTAVTVDGNKAYIGGDISADNVTFRNVEATEYDDAFDHFAGAVTAADTLTLHNYNAAQVGSSVTAQHVVLTGNSSTTIRDLTLTACTITAEAGSDVTLEGTLTLGNTATYTGTVYVADGLVFSMTDAALGNAATEYTYSQGTSGFRTIGSATLLTPGDASRLKAGSGAALTETNVNTYTGAGALAGATFSYNAETGILSAAPVNQVGSGTYYVNDAVTYNTNTPAYEASDFIIGNGGNLTLATNLKDGVTVAGAESSTTSAITLNSGTTLTKPTQVTRDIASYVVNAGALLDWSGNTTFGEVMVDLSSTVSGNGTVKVAFQNGGHSGYVKTKPSTGDSAFHGTLDLSGNFNLNSMVGNNASDITYFWHDGSFWHNNNVTVANRVELGENFIMRASGTTTFTGQVTGESLRIGWSGNSGRVHFNNALSAIDTVTLYNGASVEYNKVFTGNTIVQAGTTMAGTNSGTGTTSAAAAQQYHGAVYLQGASNSLAKIFYEDGSMFIENGVHVQGYGAIENKWDKHQYLGGLYTDGEADSVLSFSRNNQNNDAKARYVVLTDSGNFHGTINLSHRKDNSYGLIALGADAQQSLAGAVVNFNGTNTIHNTTYTNPTLLAFKKGSSISEQESGANFIANDLVAANLQDGAVAGLVGNGSVYADGLTIGTRGSSADHSFSGTLNVQSLTKTGEGTQTVTSALNLPGALSVQGGTLALTGGATLGGSVEIGTSGTLSLSGTTTLSGMVTNAGTLNLSGTVAVDTTRLVNYEVKDAGTAYSDGASGYLNDATIYLVKNNGGTVNGFDSTTFTGTTVSQDDVSGSLTFVASDTTTYYVNEALTYDNTKMGDAAKLYIAKDASLTANGAPTSAKVLTGEGTFNLATVTSAAGVALPSGVTLSATDWQGVVHLTSNGANVTAFTGTSISNLGNSSSWVELENFKGYTANGAQNFTSNLILKGDNALVIYDGYNNQNTFAGDIKGDGVLQHNYRANTLVFQGDISGWTGSLTKNNSGGDNTTVKFEGKATEINTTISKSSNGGFAIQLGDITNGASAYTFNKNVTAATMTTNGHQVVIGKDATMTLTTALSGSDALKKAISTEYSGEGTLVFTTVASGDTFSDNAQLQTAGTAYTQGVDHIIINGNIGLNNWARTQTPGGLTIGAGQEMTVNGKMRVETEFDLHVQGKLTAQQLQLGHTSSGSAHVFIEDGAEVMLGGIGYNNSDANKTFEMTGGTLDFSAAGNVVSGSGTAPTFSFLGGTLQAKENSWNFNHAAKLGAMTMNSVGASTNMTISGVLSDAAGMHGSITKTGDGTLTLSAANTFTGDVNITEGTLVIGNSQALGTADSSRNIVVGSGAVLDVNGTGNGGHTVTLAGGTLKNSRAVVSWATPQFATNLVLTADSYVDSNGQNFGLIAANSGATSIQLGDHDLIKIGSGNYMLDKATITGTGNLVVRGGNLQFRSNNGACSLQSDIVLEGGGVIGEGQGVVLGADVSMKSNAAGSYVSAAVKTEGHNLTVGGTVNMTMSGVISGNGSVTKADANAITMTAANTYTGGTTIENGALILTNSNALSSSVVTFADRTAEQAPYRTLAFTTGASYNGAAGALTGGTPINGTIAGLSGYRGTVVADTLTINVAQGGNYEFLHRYSGSTTNDAAVLQVNKLVKQGAGTQVIGGEYTTARGFTDAGLVIANGVDVQGGTLHMKTRGVVTANFDVREGATLKTTDDATNQVTADAAVKYNGTMTLHGTTAANAGTLNYTDGSTYITNALAVDGNGKLNLTWGKLQYVQALTGTNATLTVDRNSGDGSRGGYVNILSDGSYSGTINLITRAGNEMGGLIMHDAADALANTVVNFGTTNDKSLVAFITGDGTFNGNRVLTTDTFTAGSVGGLDGSKGSVKAAELTINTAEGGNYDYSGDLTVTDLVKSGAGTQALAVTANLNSLDVQGGTLKVTGGALTVAEDITIGDGGTLSLNATSDGQQSFIHGSVSVGEGGKLVLAGHDATGYKGGDNSLHDIHVQTGGEMLLGFSNSNETFVGNLTLDGTLAMAQGYSGSRIDLFTDNGHSAKVMVSNGANGVVAEGVKLELRQNDSEFAIGTGGSLTVNGTITKTGSGAGNNSFRKTGEGEMIINTALDNGNGVNNINVEEGALTLNAGAKVTGKLTLDADATLNIGEQGNVVLNNADLGSVIHNEGTLTLNGNINVLQTLNTTNATFSEVTYGYLRSATVQIADGGTVNAGENVSWSISGQSATSMGLTSSTFEGGTLTLSGEAGTMWYMNNDERTHTYNAADTTTTAILINAKPQEGTNAVLTVDTNGGVPDRLASVIVNDTTADLNLTQNTVFAASKLRLTNGGSTVLTGAGTFDLGTPVFSGNNLVMPSGVTVGDAEHWTGAVSISGSMSQWLNGASLSDLCNANSWVEFKGISGVFNSSQTVDANIRFTDNGGEAAFKTTGGFSGKTFTFNGKVSGTGTYYLTNYNNGIQTFKFNGDASAWTGTLKSSNTNTTGNQIEISNAFGATLENEAGNMQVTFKEGAVFSGSLKGSGGTMKVNSEVDAISVNALYLSNGGNVELSGGNYTIGGTSNTQGLFVGNGQLTIKADTNVTLNAHLGRNEDWQFEMKAGADKGITIAQGSSFTVDAKHSQDEAHENDYNLKVTGAQMQGATITASSNREYRLDADNITIANADVELNKRENGGNFANELQNSSFTNKGTTEVTLTNGNNTLVDLTAENGNIAIGANMAVSGTASVTAETSIKVQGGQKLQLGNAARVEAGDAVITTHKADSATATLAGTTVTATGISKTEGATVATISDADITVGTAPAEQGLLALADAVSYDITDVNLVNTNVVSYEQMTVSNVALDAASSITAHNGGTLEGSNRLTLSAGATTKDITADGTISSSQLTGLTLNGNLTIDLSEHDYARGVSDKSKFSIVLSDFTWQDLIDAKIGSYDAAAYKTATGKTLDDVFKVIAVGGNADVLHVLSVSNFNSGIKIEVQVPEPTTSVLSLLALAGMAARRRRK